MPAVAPKRASNDYAASGTKLFLSSEQTLKRKVYEVLLAWKIEQNLTKDQILEVYMKPDLFGQRATAFRSAAQIYFWQAIVRDYDCRSRDVAGLPKAPSAYKSGGQSKTCGKVRQSVHPGRMHALHYINMHNICKRKTNR